MWWFDHVLAACLAFGHFVKCFSEETETYINSLYPLFFTNLEHHIPSVRQGAAASLGNVVRAYGHPALQVSTWDIAAADKKENYF